MVLTNVAKAVEVAQELLRSADAPVNTVPSSEVKVTAGEHTTGLAAELEKGKCRIAELESFVTINFGRHKEHSEEVKQHHTEEVIILKGTSTEKVNSD